jgi:hypothetical protein
MITVRFVTVDGTSWMIDASTTRRRTCCPRRTFRGKISSDVTRSVDSYNTEPVSPQSIAYRRPDGSCSTGDHGNWLRRHPLFAGKTKFSLPGLVGMNDLPITLRDVLGVESGTSNDLPGDRQRGHPNAICC